MKITKELKKQLLAAKGLRLDFEAAAEALSCARDARSVTVVETETHRRLFQDGLFQGGVRRSGCLKGDEAPSRVWLLLWCYLSPEVRTAFTMIRSGDEVLFEIRHNDAQTPGMRARGVDVDRLVMVVYRGKHVFEFVLDIAHQIV